MSQGKAPVDSNETPRCEFWGPGFHLNQQYTHEPSQFKPEMQLFQISVSGNGSREKTLKTLINQNYLKHSFLCTWMILLACSS